MLPSVENPIPKALNGVRHRIAKRLDRESMTRYEVSEALVDLRRTIMRIQSAPTLHATQQLTLQLRLEAFYLNNLVFVGGCWSDARRVIDDELADLRREPQL